VSSIPLRWGGMHFDSGGLVFNYSSPIIKYGVNYSVFVVAKFDVYAMGGSSLYGRQALVWPGGDSQMFWQDINGLLRITVYDTGSNSWKAIGVDISSIYNDVNIYYGYFKESYEGVYVYDLEGNVLASNSRNDILEPLTGEKNYLCIGSNINNYYKMCGDVYSVAVFDKVLSDSSINNLLENWMCEECYKNIDGCIFACIFDRLKYGDAPYDFINDVYGEPVDPNHSPRWKLRLVKDMEG